MIRFKKYLIIIPIITTLFIYLCVTPILEFQQYLQTEYAPELSANEEFLNLFGPNGNFINPIKIVVLNLIVFLLALLYLFFTDNQYILVRIKSRRAFVTRRIIDTLVFSFVFVLLLEVVNVMAAFFTFDFETVGKFNFIQYSLLDLISLLLFYFRAGMVFFGAEIITSKKFSAFIAAALYLIEFFSSYFVGSAKNIWLPYKDAVSVCYLLTGDMQPTGIFSVIFRGITLNAVIILVIYFLFAKKDVLGNEKK